MRKNTTVARNLSATINALEELEPCFIRESINDAIARQCEAQHVPPVKYSDDNFGDVLQQLLENERKTRTKTIPIIGTVGDGGLRLKPEYESKEHQEEARQAARIVDAFLKGGPPDFLMEATLSALDQAFDHCGIQKPSDELGVLDYTEENLYPVFLRTRLTHWADMYHNKDRVLDSVDELLHNEATPHDLFEAIAQYVCRQVNEINDEIFHRRPVLTEILQSVPPEELRGAIAKAAEAN